MMLNRVLFIIFFALSACYLYGSDELTVAPDRAVFASFSLNPLWVDNQATLVAGARMLYRFDKSYSIGLGSYNMISRNMKADFLDSVAMANPTLEYNYFGAEFEWTFNPADFFSFSLRNNLCLGHVRYSITSTERAIAGKSATDYGEDWFYFYEPSLNLTLNLTNWLQSGAGAGWRIAFDGDYRYRNSYFGNSDLSGASLMFFVKLGNFD